MNEDSNNLLYIIIGVCIGVLLIIIISIIIILYVRRQRNQEDNSYSEIEMDEEGGILLPRHDQINTINLFTTTTIEESDPFADDFEEHLPGFIF